MQVMDPKGRFRRNTGRGVPLFLEMLLRKSRSFMMSISPDCGQPTFPISSPNIQNAGQTPWRMELDAGFDPAVLPA